MATVARSRTHRPRRAPAGWTALLLALLALQGAACSAISSDRPPVADSTFVGVLVELHLHGARAEYAQTEGGMSMPSGLRDSILARYGLDAAGFERAVAYYGEHPEDYARLYDTVLDRLSAERAPGLEGPAFPGN